MEAVDPQIEDAEQRMEAVLSASPQAVSARYDRRVSRIMVQLSNGLELAFPPHLAEGLADATALQLSVIEITPTGLGLHWPLLDADLYVPGLLGGVFGSPTWMAQTRKRRSRSARATTENTRALLKGRAASGRL